MNRKWIVPFLLVLLASVAAGQQQRKMQDVAGYKDPALFTRMPDYYLSVSSSFKESQFDYYEFSVMRSGKAEKQRIEGHKLVYCYYFDNSTGKPPASALQVKRNYQEAIKRLGGEVLYDPPNDAYSRTTLRVSKNGLESWAEIMSTGPNAYYLTIVERKVMQQDVVANADALKNGLAESGHVEVSGIYFDFNKADLKPESKPALGEVAKLLKSNPALRVWVVGHTDNVGTVQANVTLSNARAESVVRALVQEYGIDASRLIPYGNGPYAPVATNATEEGRAKNRRVELVSMQAP